MKYLIYSFLLLLILASQSFSQKIVIISWDKDGLVEKGFRDEVLSLFPTSRFYTFGCNKDINILMEYHQFVKKINPDLIFINGKNAVKFITKSKLFKLPIIFHIKGNPIDEDIIASNNMPVAKISGVSTEILVLEQIKVLFQIANIKNLGILKESLDVEYIKSVKEINRLSKFFNYNVREILISDIIKNQDILKDIDAVYIPYSQVPGVEVIDKINKLKIPTLSENDFLVVNQGALMALVVDEYRAGRFSGKKAIEVLNGREITKMPVTRIEHFMVVVNINTAKKIGVQIPIKFLIIADKIVR